MYIRLYSIRLYSNRLYSIRLYSNRIRSRYYTHDIIMRQKLLRTIYKDFNTLEKDSAEYIRLAKSGSVWKSYYKPFDLDFDKSFEKENIYILKEIDAYNKVRKIPLSEINKMLTAVLAHQSVCIEGNSLKIGDSLIILKALEQYQDCDSPPPAHELLPDASVSDVLELRNQLILTKLVQESPHMISEEQLLIFHKILLRDMPNETVSGFGKPQKSGNYRLLPISARGYPLTIYPYPLEIYALMREWFGFRCSLSGHLFMHNQSPYIHPIIAAIRILIVFLHIHPFHDGNGRLGRMLFTDYLLKNNYPPIIFSTIDRKDYCNMISESQQGDPTILYHRILEAMLDFQISLLSL